MKHSDGYTEHVQVICPKCKSILLECRNCEIDSPRQIKWKYCIEVLDRSDCIGHN